jgi:hypothetical protein
MHPFKRSDGLFELAIIGNFGLAYAYKGREKVTHFVEDTEVDRDTVHSDSYYAQIDSNFSVPEFQANAVHLIRNIEIGDEIATYEDFGLYRDGDDEDDWIERKCPASDFPYLLEREELIPMKEAEINDS